MVLDTTPGRKDAHGFAGDVVSSKNDQSEVGQGGKFHNRTFADSVLRQGMLSQKA